MSALVGKEKVYESKVRRLAARLGYSLTKSRKDISYDNQGHYMLLYDSRLALGGRYEARLADVETFFTREEARLRG